MCDFEPLPDIGDGFCAVFQTRDVTGADTFLHLQKIGPKVHQLQFDTGDALHQCRGSLLRGGHGHGFALPLWVRCPRM